MLTQTADSSDVGSLAMGPFRDGDQDLLRRIFSERKLTEQLYPLADPSADIEAVVDDWLSPCTGKGDVKLALRSENAELRGGIRLDSACLSFFVDLNYRGQGHGWFMVDWMLNNVMNQPGQTYFAATRRSNSASIHLLQRAGFTFSGVVDEHPGIGPLLRFILVTRH